jgi:hypothetical protein
VIARLGTFTQPGPKGSHEDSDYSLITARFRADSRR